MAGDEPLNRHDDFLYSLFVPARASLAFPCFDQPDLKARWQLTLHVPHGWTAVSNGRESGRVTTRDDDSLIFDETEPISTVSVRVRGRAGSRSRSADRGGRTFRMFHRETDATRLTRNRDAIFDLHAKALDWLEDYTGIPYPFGKFDFVLIPSFQFGGMEHPGAIFYNANALLLDESATQNQALGRANVIAHETSHMWFGDLVTMRWFNDVWMKEVFANFLPAKIVNPSFPAMNHELRFLLQHYPAAYDVDRTDGANPDSAGARQPDRGRLALRRDHLSEGADRDAAARAARRRRGVSGRAPRVPAGASVRQRDLARSGGRDRHANAGGSRRLEPRVGEERGPADDPDGPRSRATARSRRSSLRQSDPRSRGVFWPERLRWRRTGRTHESSTSTLDGADTPVPSAAGSRRRTGFCRRWRAWVRALRARREQPHRADRVARARSTIR